MYPSLDPKAYFVGFNLVKGIGAVRLKALIDHYGSAEAAWKAPADSLRASGLPFKILENLLRVRKDCSLDLILEKYQHQGIQVITWDDAGYPRRLHEIDQPPPLLYIRGEWTDQDEFCVAVVGTRHPTAYGKQVAEELAAFLAVNGITVVSGLARGIDRHAHESSLKAGGRTVAVLGSGVDYIYPPENLRLAEQIIAGHGAVISDYAPGTPPESINFPPRNRIISGMTLASVIVEAGETSGALITASFAAGQGRDVFAVPGGIYAPQSKGANRLIRDGAIPLLKFEDIMENLQLGQVLQKQQARRVLKADDAIEARLLDVLGDEPQHIDEICSQSGLPIDQVSATLTLMELKGMVRQSGGMDFSVIREIPADYRAGENE
jgi:DNA processing protein